MPRAKLHSLLGRLSAAAVLVISVTACQSPPAGPPNYSDRYSVQPVLTNYVLATKFEPGTGKLALEHEGRLQRFMSQFYRRGRSVLVIATTRDAAGADADRHMAVFKRRLANEGIDPRIIDVRSGSAPLGGDHSVVMSFRGYEVEVPECGDWTGSAAFNPGNLPHTNYGCSYQRNFGLMLSDPGELLQSRNAEQIESQHSAGFVHGLRDPESESFEELELGLSN